MRSNKKQESKIFERRGERKERRSVETKSICNFAKVIKTVRSGREALERFKPFLN